MRTFLTLFFFIFCILQPLAVSAKEEQYYSVGVVPQFESRRIAEIWMPVLEELEKISGLRLKLQASPSIPEFEKQFEAGMFDFAYMNPYHAIIANQLQGYIPLVRDSERQLYGIIVVRNDSPMQSVADLNGAIVAFPAPNALGAALIPRTEFARKHHIKIDEHYVKSHSSVYLNVILGKAAAGGGVQKTLSQQPEKIRKQLRVLYETTRVPPHPIAAHPRVSRVAKDKLRDAFVELGNNQSGKVLLSKIPIKKVGIASLGDYDSLRNMGLEDFYVRDSK